MAGNHKTPFEIHQHLFNNKVQSDGNIINATEEVSVVVVADAVVVVMTNYIVIVCRTYYGLYCRFDVLMHCMR